MKAQKDWRNIGTVWVKTVFYTGRFPNETRVSEINEFEDLEAAVRHYSNYIISLTNKNSYGWSYRSRLLNRIVSGAPMEGPEFRDEAGMKIPLWKIFETYNNLPNVYGWASRYWDRSDFKEGGKFFRNGPVVNVSCWKASRRGHYRRLRTTQEIRENDFLMYDEDAQDYGILARPSRRRHNLPTWWDDIPDSRRGNSWKHYRDTQWFREPKDN